MTFAMNESPLDRVIRIVLGVALAAVAIGGIVAAPWLYFVGAVAAILVGTGIVGFCPLYAILHIRTKSTAH